MTFRNKICECPIQLICPLEMCSTMIPKKLKKGLFVANKAHHEAEATRPKRLAKTDA